eukprot:TRINITY_DN68225_c0_g1_i1.p1 TRINITY_DN68225_c0_g1~~TRINITY_DN68225_c0_g1_i1.p1  ORF type:complete len:244 (-),score=41.50 TRINITY_DN68225_c0_g1_i1:431-1162(-)
MPPRKRPAAAVNEASTPSAKRSRSSASRPDKETYWWESYAGGTADYYRKYMDKEWGVPIYGPGRSVDDKLFEMISLEGAQAGLSWDCILRKRDAYRKAFNGFKIAKVANFNKQKVDALVNSPGEGSDVIVRNRSKIESVVQNARLCLQVAKEHGSLCKYIWSFVNGRPQENRWRCKADLPAETEEARVMSKDMKRRGFGYVGPTVCYALMQSIGMVNDHPVGTPQWRRVSDFVKRRFGTKSSK